MHDGDGDVQRPSEYSGVNRGHTLARAGLNLASVIPGIGPFLAATAGVWSEHEQEKAEAFFRYCIKMLQDEMAEKAQTIIEVMARLDMHDEKIADRVKGAEFHSLLRKALRDWAGSESEKKREYVRNVLSHAAHVPPIVSDDVVRLFIDWLKQFSDFHFAVVGVIFNRTGITRGGMWRQMGRSPVREDSADADLFRFLIRDLSTGGLIRQDRETDMEGNFLRKQPQRRAGKGQAPKTMQSAFDEEDGYVLTGLGHQFVHYAMTEIPPKIEYNPEPPEQTTSSPTG
jgi:hypothetical protein